MQRKHFKKFVVGGALLATLGLVAACGDNAAKVTPEEIESAEIFDSVEFSVDVKNHEIILTGAVDSLVVGSLEALGGSKYFIATDDDPVDPSFDWDEELKEGSVIKFGDSNSVRIVVLDEDNRTIAVWEVSFPEEKSSSSKTKNSSSSTKKDDEDSEKSSSSEADDESSSSEEETVADSSSSEEALESSSSEDVVESSSSEIVEESSSSEEVEESSSSEEVEESSSSEEVVESSSSETVESSSSEEIVSSSSEEAVESSSSEIVESSSSEEIIESSSSEVVESSSSLDQPQLPGTSFDSWDKSFWGSTSDAMATEGTGKYKVPLLGWTVDVSMKADEPNAVFENGRVTLTTETVVGHSTGFDGGWKMAGGFYFAGSYLGTDGASIYMADNKDAGADNRPADFSQYMKFGQPFVGRPVSFDVTYAYNHKENSNKTYLQSSLIYVVLVSADNKIVAAGKISDRVSVDMSKKTVELTYGSDAGLIADEAVGIKGLSRGNGDEDVASIRVMFASSALAYVADGGSSSQMEKNFRGGEGSQLIIDEFKLNY